MSEVSINKYENSLTSKNQRILKIISLIMVITSTIASILVFIFPFGSYPSLGGSDVVVDIGLWGYNIGSTRIISILICITFLSNIIFSILLLLQNFEKISSTKLLTFIAIFGNIILSSLSIALTITLAVIIPPLSTAPTGSWLFSVSLYSSLISSILLLAFSFVSFKYSDFSRIYSKTSLL
ncbi:MAG TPA: hypothetical protein VMZ29_16265 [Candidatus Bathyarchaeia archaeon]|nr:hypothetical protein [Candidatus Bathyarchaeia archaeon]